MIEILEACMWRLQVHDLLYESDLLRRDIAKRVISGCVCVHVHTRVCMCLCVI